MKNKDVSQFISNLSSWKKEITKLRKIVNDSELIEDFKWKQPCYTFNEQNILIISSFKNFCAVSFFQGSLLKDKLKLLVAPGENSQATRQLRFTSVEEIVESEFIIKEYIKESILLAKNGKKVTFSNSIGDVPNELEHFFKNVKGLKEAFYKLTPGRQRAYLLFFNGAKSEEAKNRRIEKYISRILDGKGINYCTCGQSKKMPNCDGSHKFL